MSLTEMNIDLEGKQDSYLVEGYRSRSLPLKTEETEEKCLSRIESDG